jgi:hypothetical protein
MSFKVYEVPEFGKLINHATLGKEGLTEIDWLTTIWGEYWHSDVVVPIFLSIDSTAKMVVTQSTNEMAARLGDRFCRIGNDQEFLFRLNIATQFSWAERSILSEFNVSTRRNGTEARVFDVLRFQRFVSVALRLFSLTNQSRGILTESWKDTSPMPKFNLCHLQNNDPFVTG